MPHLAVVLVYVAVVMGYPSFTPPPVALLIALNYKLRKSLLRGGSGDKADWCITQLTGVRHG